MSQTFIDQLGKTLQIDNAPKRIISLVPSQTELLYDLGLDKEVVGITKFCVHPDSWFKTKVKVGGTKDFRFDQIQELRPDLIIGNKEENYREGIERLVASYPVWMSNVVTLADALTMISSVGALVRREEAALEIVGKIRIAFEQLRIRTSRKVLYLIWKKPWMAAGRNTFINSMLEKMGLTNCLTADRYPELTDDEIKKLQPDLVLLSSEPYPFREKHLSLIEPLAPSAKIKIVDGEMFSWYGSRLIQAAGYFNSLDF